MSAVVFDIGMYPTAPPRQVAAVARRAEALGYDTLWLGDSHLIWREAYVTLAHVAGATERIRLGTGVTNCATRHVTVLAGLWATLNELSGGRAVAGIGVGDTALRSMGKQPAKLAELRQAVQIMRQLWAGESPDVGGGTARLWCEPCRIPVYLSASGPRTLELAGEVGDGVIFPVGVVPEFVGAAMERVAAGARRAGRDPTEVDPVCWSVCCIRDNSEQATDGARSFVASLLRHPFPFSLPAEDLAAQARVKAHYDYARHMDAGSEHRALVPAATVRRFALAGTPAEVIRKVVELRRMGIRRIAAVLLQPDWEETMVRLAREVIPLVQQAEGGE